MYKKHIAKIDSPTDNDKLIAINRAHIEALKLDSAEEIFNVFLSSERVYEDLELALDYPNEWRQHFVLREYVPVPIEYEFRSFVIKSEMKCMCQYYHYLYFPHIVAQKDMLEEKILSFFNEVKDLVPLESGTYVMDFAVDLENDKVYIIELNPYGEYEGMGTSTCMFDPIGDKDKLFGNVWEFRVETEPFFDIWSILSEDWHDVLKGKL